MNPLFVRCSAAAMLAILAGCALENSLVGGRCREGTVETGRACVAPPNVPLSGTTNPPVGSPPTATDAGAPADAGARDADTLPPFWVTPVVPVPPEPWVPPPLVIEPLTCTAPLVACNDVCIPVSDDGANCGACGKVCASNLCVAGVCQGTSPGDVVVIGHDYGTTLLGSSQAKIFANALKIPTTEPIRVLAYEDGASNAAIAQTRVIAQFGLGGRKAEFTRADSASALTSPTLGDNYDVVLIYEIAGVDPVATGLSWKAPLATFATKGGVVIALDRGTSSMPALLTNAGLLDVAGHTTLPLNARLVVSAPSDVVGSQVLSPYAPFGSAVSFQGVPAQTSDLTWVVRNEVGNVLGDPVVVHRVVR